jgi:hypothetical protein
MPLTEGRQLRRDFFLLSSRVCRVRLAFQYGISVPEYN